jgi:hypothetical protein
MLGKSRRERELHSQDYTIMVQQVNIAPMNALIFVSDSGGGDLPEAVWGATILHTDTCISIRCLPDVDGPTEITLGSSEDVDPGYAPELDGMLEASSREIIVWSLGDWKTGEVELLRTSTEAERIRIRIWRSHPEWPEQVTIGLG